MKIVLRQEAIDYLAEIARVDPEIAEKELQIIVGMCLVPEQDLRLRTMRETDDGGGLRPRCKVCGTTNHHTDEKGNIVKNPPRRRLRS